MVNTVGNTTYGKSNYTSTHIIYHNSLYATITNLHLNHVAKECFTFIMMWTPLSWERGVKVLIPKRNIELKLKICTYNYTIWGFNCIAIICSVNYTLCVGFECLPYLVLNESSSNFIPTNKITKNKEPFIMKNFDQLNRHSCTHSSYTNVPHRLTPHEQWASNTNKIYDNHTIGGFKCTTILDCCQGSLRV